MTTKINRSIALKLFFFFFFIYLLTASGIIDVTPGNISYLTAKSLIEHGDVDIPKIDALWYDSVREGKDGRYYATTGICQPLFMVPLVKVAGYAGATFLNQIVSALVCVVIFLFCLSLGYSRRNSVIISLIYGLSTIAWPYSKTTFNQAQEVLLILLVIYFAFLYTKRP